MPPKSRSFLSSLQFAWAGIARALRRERNMKLHAVSSIMVAVVGMAIPLDQASRAALLFAITLVWFAEILNTALEAFVDLHIREFHQLAMLAKDAAAAAVMVAAVATIFVFGDILYAHWEEVERSPAAVWRGVLFGVPLSGIAALLLFSRAGRGGVLLLGALALGLLMPLLWNAANPIFAILALTILLVIVSARLGADPIRDTLR